MLNKVDNKAIIDAIDYFFAEGMIEQMNSDERYYVKALINKIANIYKIKLQWDNDDDNEQENI